MRLGWQTWLVRQWQTRNWFSCTLWPLSAITWLVVRWRQRQAVLHPPKPNNVPTVVVGNVLAGGAGKTPIVMALAAHWKAQGLHVGVVSRGHGRSLNGVIAVHPTSQFEEVGDEPLLVWLRCQVPVFVGQDRAACCQALLAAHPHTQVLISDDGMQHLGLHRDIEVCVFDERGLGNGWLLPAGPLREPWPRPLNPHIQRWNLSSQALSGIEAVPVQRRLANYAIQANGRRQALAAWGDQPVNALAGIAKPEPFFDALRRQGLNVALAQAWPDHDPLKSFEPQEAPGDWFCTEKDAVKLWPRHPQIWAVPLEVLGLDAWMQDLDRVLTQRISFPHGHQTA
ncbi:MAG: tetraacyldisaccharide 4'-kinase [Betaproteobacteria bacterium]|nr:tetraacyldisaccharide 4'-kinase [Betaproteobacteria bacterium]NBY05859.1 tetraacyldisaccharide 4'-kinase [Betaproteobacteria bacterium]